MKRGGEAARQAQMPRPKAAREPATRGRAKTLALRLLAWYDAGHRDLPWRRTADPYRIWVSEIMLQQTRAQTVIPYYERFLSRFASIEALAGAPEDELLALWSGLGYYSRARNLRRAAQSIVTTGGFPCDYTGLRALAGVGDYTAAAIASIAFGLPHAAVDGNVLRVVARVAGDAADIGHPRTRARFSEIAAQWLDRARPGAFNQAMMELGATVCLPRHPQCAACPLAELCVAHQRGTAASLPIKRRQREPVRIESTLLVVRRGDRILLRQRPASDRRLAGFWELPSRDDLPDARAGAPCGEFQHAITHHRYAIQVLRASIRSCSPPWQWLRLDSLADMPLSTTARKALQLAGAG